MSPSTRAERAEGVLVHHTLMYASPEELVAKALPFFEEGLESRSSVMTMTYPANTTALRAALGRRSGTIRFTRARAWYATPAEVIGRYTTYLREQLAQGSASAYVVAEVPWPRNDERLDREWLRYEAVINRILADAPVRFVCLYDTKRHDPSIIEAALASHRSEITEHGVRPSTTFVPPERMMRRLTPRLRTPTDPGRRFGPEDPVPAAAYVGDRAREAGVDESTARNASAATIEILGPSMLHRTPVTVTAWTEGERFVWQIERQGGAGVAPWSGYGPPPSDDPGGWGPWLARHLTDTMEIGRGVEGPAVQLTVGRGRAHDIAP
jgi:hypothetical protein